MKPYPIEDISPIEADSEHRSPRYTTRWEDIPVAKIELRFED